jgi:hypothetical protein
MVLAINGQLLTKTRLPPRTGWLLLFAIDREGARIEALSRLRLPCVIGSCGTQSCHAMVALTGDEQFCIPVVGSDAIAAWPQWCRLPRLMHRSRDFGIGHGPSRRLHLGDRRRLSRVTTRRDVPRVPHPGRGVLLGLGGVESV